MNVVESRKALKIQERKRQMKMDVKSPVISHLAAAQLDEFSALLSREAEPGNFPYITNYAGRKAGFQVRNLATRAKETLVGC